MYIKFLNNKNIYNIKISVQRAGIVVLHNPLPEGVDVTAGFEVLTSDKDGKVYGKYLDYTTIYREMDDGSIALSNDGSVWTPPAEPEPIPEPEPYVPTLEEVKLWKKNEISTACEKIIHDGIDVVMPDGSVEHFSLESNDQINLFGKQAQLAAGVTQLEYHQDGHPCRYYTAEEMRLIIKEAMEHVSYHTTYCNAMNMWIAGAETVEEVNAIFYGADIPEEYQSEVLKDYLTKLMEEVEGAVNESETVS